MNIKRKINLKKSIQSDIDFEESEENYEKKFFEILEFFYEFVYMLQFNLEKIFEYLTYSEIIKEINFTHSKIEENRKNIKESKIIY
jgi:hypothetical protein